MDTILKLQGNKIAGLPDEYNPASFDKKNYTLTVSNQKYVFPKFLIDLIESEGKNPKITIHASWYHDGPPYVSLNFMVAENNGYSCLFALDDLSKMGVTKDTPIPDGYRTENVKWTKQQLKELAASRTIRPISVSPSK